MRDKDRESREDRARYLAAATNRMTQRAQDADRLEERLRRLEWSGRREVRGHGAWLRRVLARTAWATCCPVCEGSPFTGHRTDCWLGLELHGHRQTSS